MRLLRYAIIAALLAPANAVAQDAADKRVAEMMANARDAYAVPKKPTRCQETAVAGEIVVCGREDDGSNRIEGDAGSTNTGVPHTDVGTHSNLGGVSVRGCFLQKCPKPVYLIDLSKIPLAPAGSDADKIAKGEMRAP